MCGNVCNINTAYVYVQFYVLNMQLSHCGIQTSVAYILIHVGSCPCVMRRCVMCDVMWCSVQEVAHY
jgi:hypothetical protein